MSVRLAYLCGQYPRATDTFIQREVAALRADGIHVEMISVRRPSALEFGSDEQQAERQATHYLLPCSPLRLISDHLQLLLRSPLRYLRAVWTALTVRSPGIKSLFYQCFYFAEAGLVAMRLIRQDLQHVHNHSPDAGGYVTMLACKLADRTYSVTLHGFGILAEPRRWNLQEKLEGCLFAICISQFTRSQAMLWTDRRFWDRFHVVHCGVDPERYVIRRHCGPGRQLLFVGRLDPVKGLPVLLQAMSALVTQRRDVHLHIAGDGPMRSDLELLTAELGINAHVTFHGYLTQSQLAERLQTADVVVMTSFCEGIPVGLMEAMACGVPVVAPRITGIPELVDDGVSGYLTPCGDVDALVKSMDFLLESADMRQRFGAAGRKKIERDFHLATAASMLSQIFSRRLSRETAEVPLGDVSAGAPAFCSRIGHRDT